MNPVRQRVPRLFGAALLFVEFDAHAQGHAVILGASLAAAAVLGGLVMGAIAGLRGQLGLWPSFGVYLGLLCAVASTRFGSLEVLPLTLVLGAIAGVLP